ncbi:MAG: acyl-CoA dehydrogenase family protein [Burkholderiales bacterium]
MVFTQAPPELGNQYDDDRVLRSYLHRTLPVDVCADIEPQLSALGALAGGELYADQLRDLRNEPQLVQWDAWGNRVDRIELTPLWRKAERLAAELGVVAAAYERRHGAWSRIHQFSLAYLFTPSTDLYSCPLAMTDGAAAALVASGNPTLIERAVPRLTSRDPARFWTSGQWMTEATGGSDVGSSETVARREPDGWGLYGRKWFTSAIASQMALTLARPERNPSGGKGLALFYVETRDARGMPNRITVNRLKDKLGTRKVPTAELALEGTPATLVCGESDGVKNIAPMLNVTRAWNSVSAVALMRRGLALARDFAKRRSAFGAPLAEKPLHVDTLAGLQAEFEAAFHLSFFIAELLGRAECGRASAEQQALLRILTPVTKLTTGRQVIAVLAEVIEAFGGAGYVEDTGLPMLLRDAHVLPIWEGTTNVLALETLRALQSFGGLDVVEREVRFLVQGVRQVDLLRISARVEQILQAAQSALARNLQEPGELEANARRLALTLGRAVALGLLARQAQWCLDNEQDPRPLAAARRFAASGLNLLHDMDAADARMLGRDDIAHLRSP